MTLVDQISLVILLTFSAIASYKDIKTKKIPNWIPLTLFWFWMLAVIVKWILADLNILDIQVIDVFTTCAKQVITSAVICCILAASVVLVNKGRKKSGKPQKSVFGMGDVKLLMIVCLYFGITGSCLCIIFACLSFLIYIFIVRLAIKQKISAAPFAPFIFIGEIIAIVVLYFI